MAGNPEVVIIGGGVIGVSIAFHLAKLGCHNVAVLEKNYVGSGSTEKCAGGIRQQFSVPANIRLSMESVRFFEHFTEQTGSEIDFHQNGYLMLATTEADRETLRDNVTLQQQLGLQVDFLLGQDVIKLVPGLNADDILGASFCPSDGYADPYSVVNGFVYSAKQLGVRIIEGAEVTGIEIIGNKVTGVNTTAGRISSPIVINAAGPYAGIVGKMVGLDIPVKPVRRHIFVTEPVFHRDSLTQDSRWRTLPMVVDFHNGFWLRREGSCLIFGMRNPAEKEGFDISIDWDFFTTGLAPVAGKRLPLLADIGIMRAQAGLHPDNPDDMAILGGAPGIRGLYLACGLSGHGFMHSPAVGRLMAELVLGRIEELPEADLFSLARFQENNSPKEKALI
jgi:sarcosine oxidase subunit beta